MTDSPAAVTWIGTRSGHLEIIDQTLLPLSVEILALQTPAQVVEAIRRLAVRGAPNIGITGAYGLVLAVREPEADAARLLTRLDQAARKLAAARPTAVNLAWATERVRRRAHLSAGLGAEAIRDAIFEEACALQAEDRAMCQAMARIGARLIADGDGLLTHCNTGALAASHNGTALGVIMEAHAQGKSIQVFVDETRPLLQGARLTTWELMRAGIKTTLICDNTAAQVMREGRVQRIFVGADRIVRCGDVANKVGTYGLAVLAQAHKIPFYVVAPSSTFDLETAAGSCIQIEQRCPDEVTEGLGRRSAPAGVNVYCPAFDVTPARLVCGIVTERGLIQPVTAETIRKTILNAEAASG